MSAIASRRGDARAGNLRRSVQELPAADRAAVLVVAVLMALATALRFWRIGHQGFWFDEGNTALLVHHSLGRMATLIPQSESTPPLYYGVAWIWARIFGFGEAGLRSLSALAGVITVPLAYLAGWRLVSRRTGLITAALTTCSPLLIWYSQEARAYSLLVMLSAAALTAFAFALESPTRRPLVAWAAACALALATHYYAVVVVIPQALWLLWRHRGVRDVQVALGVVVLCGLALIPLALSQNSTGHDSWIAHGPLGVRLRQIIPQLLIGTDAPARTALKFLAMALALGAVVLLAWRADPAVRRRAAIPGALSAGGFLLSLVFVAAGSDALITRNIIGLWLPAAIAVAAGLSVARGAWGARLGVAGAAALCAIGVTCALGVSLSTDLQRPDWRLVARDIGARPVAGGRLILIQHYRTLLPLSLYLPGLKFARTGRYAGVREIDVISMQSPGQTLCWWGAWCNLIGSGAQRAYDVPGFHGAWRRRAQHFTIVRLVAGVPREVTRGAVSGALRTTSLKRDALLFQR